MCLFSMNRFPTWAVSPMADRSWRSQLGILAGFSHRLMQSTPGDGKWAGIGHAGESRSLPAFYIGFLGIMPFINNASCHDFYSFGGSVTKSFPWGQGLEWLL